MNKKEIYESLSESDKKTYDRIIKISPCDFGTYNGELVLFTEYPPGYDQTICYEFTRLWNTLTNKKIDHESVYETR